MNCPLCSVKLERASGLPRNHEFGVDEQLFWHIYLRHTRFIEEANIGHIGDTRTYRCACGLFAKSVEMRAHLMEIVQTGDLRLHFAAGVICAAAGI